MYATAPMVGPGRRRRVTLYSHDTQGLGHVRRNLRLAEAVVTACPEADVLLLTGAPEVAGLPRPPRTDVVTLPTLRKDVDGGYAPRALRAAKTPEVLRMRSRIIEAAVTAFAPDLFVVDKVARGAGGELDRTLRRLRARDSKVVLGLREILDDPRVARAEWDADGSTETVRRFYDQIWVYGDARVGDPLRECGVPQDVVDRAVHTGFLVPPRDRRRAPAGHPYVLCQVGGGQDGVQLAESFACARMPLGHRGVLVTGPYMPSWQVTRVERLAREQAIDVREFVPGTDDLVHHAAAVVSMAGYNSVCELLAAPARALLVPRERPRREQVVRADRLAALGLVDTIAAPRAHPAALTAWLAGAVLAGPPQPTDLDLDGLARVPDLVRRLLDDHDPGWRRSAGPATTTRGTVREVTGVAV